MHAVLVGREKGYNGSIFIPSLFLFSLVMPNSCVYCGHGKRKGERISLIRFPKDTVKRQQWLAALDLSEDMINDDSRVCSRHFLHGDLNSIPSKAKVLCLTKKSLF